MLRQLALIVLFFPIYSQAAFITNDESVFRSVYQPSLTEIDFSRYAPSDLPQGEVAYSSGKNYYMYGEAWINGVVIETRNPNDPSFARQVHIWNSDSKLLTAASQNTFDQLAIQLYRPQIALALYTSSGFFGWIPEIGTNNSEDALLWLPTGTSISKLGYGPTVSVAPVPIPGSAVFLTTALIGIFGARQIKNGIKYDNPNRLIVLPPNI